MAYLNFLFKLLYKLATTPPPGVLTFETAVSILYICDSYCHYESYIKASLENDLSLASTSAILQPWSSDSSLGSRKLEIKPETDGTSTPGSTGMRLHEFVSKTVSRTAVYQIYPHAFFGGSRKLSFWILF